MIIWSQSLGILVYQGSSLKHKLILQQLSVQGNSLHIPVAKSKKKKRVCIQNFFSWHNSKLLQSKALKLLKFFSKKNLIIPKQLFLEKKSLVACILYPQLHFIFLEGSRNFFSTSSVMTYSNAFMQRIHGARNYTWHISNNTQVRYIQFGCSDFRDCNRGKMSSPRSIWPGLYWDGKIMLLMSVPCHLQFSILHPPKHSHGIIVFSHNIIASISNTSISYYRK